MVKIKLPKEININIDVDLCKGNHNRGFSKDTNSDIEERRKAFSGEDFKL